MDENVRNRVTPHTQMYMCIYTYIYIYVHYAYANRIPSISHKREAPQRSRLFQARHRGEILRGSAAGCSSEEHKGGDLWSHGVCGLQGVLSDVMEVASGQKVEIVELPPNWITVHVIPVCDGLLMFFILVYVAIPEIHVHSFNAPQFLKTAVRIQTGFRNWSIFGEFFDLRICVFFTIKSITHVLICFGILSCFQLFFLWSSLPPGKGKIQICGVRLACLDGAVKDVSADASWHWMVAGHHDR